jgi:tetratricopeptide (TPR) repeat protein
VFDSKSLLDKGWTALGNHQPEEACDLFAQAVAEARFSSNPKFLTRALMALGKTECSMNHPATAIDCYREAAAVCERAGDPAGQVTALIEVAEIFRTQKKSEKTTAVCEQLLAIPQLSSSDAPLPRARALHMLAKASEYSADNDELALLLQAAAALYETAGECERAAECKSDLAFLQGC